MWNKRASNIANDELLDEPLEFCDPYMQWYCRITRRFMSHRGALVEALAHGMTSIHQLTLGYDVSILRVRDVVASTLAAIHADYRIYNMLTSFKASHQSSHEDTCSKHDTPVYTPSIPLNEFETLYTLYTPSAPLNELETPHTPSVLLNMAFETTKAFQFNRIPTFSRHFNASPIMMNLSGTTSIHNGGRHDIDEIQPEDVQNSLRADVGPSNVSLALNRNVRVVKRTHCGTESHYLGSDYDFF
ncbi:hypothetical protein Syun_024871 [Stephania yunnanensis]|uniref:Uncharacterized protein n=1 Tax=Stephania yunnanensis TaxID=152371 RepID=A0AAP0ER17_9MAGN